MQYDEHQQDARRYNTKRKRNKNYISAYQLIHPQHAKALITQNNRKKVLALNAEDILNIGYSGHQL